MPEFSIKNSSETTLDPAPVQFRPINIGGSGEVQSYPIVPLDKDAWNKDALPAETLQPVETAPQVNENSSNGPKKPKDQEPEDDMLTKIADFASAYGPMLIFAGPLIFAGAYRLFVGPLSEENTN